MRTLYIMPLWRFPKAVKSHILLRVWVVSISLKTLMTLQATQKISAKCKVNSKLYMLNSVFLCIFIKYNNSKKKIVGLYKTFFVSF